MAKEYLKGIGLMCIWFILFLSYLPLAEEIDDLATNETTTNSIVVFLNSWFGLFWSFLIAMIIGLSIWYFQRSF